MSGSKVDILDPLIAAETKSVNAALLFQKIRAFCAYHQAEKTHLHEGRHWCYNTVEGFTELLPYLTPKQIRTGLTKLEDADLIVTGNFNKYANDRTKWYALGDRFHANLNEQKSPVQQPDPSAPEGKWKEGNGDIPFALEGNSAFALEGNSASAPEGKCYTHKTPKTLKTPPLSPKGGRDDLFEKLWESVAGLNDRGYYARAQKTFSALSADQQTQAVDHAVDYARKHPDRTVANYIARRGWEDISAAAQDGPERPEDPDHAALYDAYAAAGRLNFYACWLTPAHVSVSGDKITPLKSSVRRIIRQKGEPQVLKRMGFQIIHQDGGK